MSRSRSRGSVTLKINLSPAVANEFSPRKSYHRFLRKHRTTRKVGRGIRRGVKRGVGWTYRRL